LLFARSARHRTPAPGQSPRLGVYLQRRQPPRQTTAVGLLGLARNPTYNMPACPSSVDGVPLTFWVEAGASTKCLRILAFAPARCGWGFLLASFRAAGGMNVKVPAGP